MSVPLFTDLPTSVTIHNISGNDIVLSRVGTIADDASRVVSLASRLESKRLALWRVLKSAKEAGVIEFTAGADDFTGTVRYNNASGADVEVDGLVLEDGEDTDVYFDRYSAGERNRKFKMLKNLVAASVLTVVDAEAEDPTIDTVLPAVVSAQGGDTITISGDNFVPGATVTVDGEEATDVLVVDDNTITCVVPASVGAPNGSATAVDVVVTNPNTETGTAAASLTYGPVITSLDVVTGAAAGGTAVVITGKGFVAGSQVVIGGNAATEGTITATTLAFTTPAHAAGAVNVVVTNPDGSTFTASNAFTYT